MIVNGFPPLTIPAKADDFVDVIVSYVDGKYQLPALGYTDSYSDLRFSASGKFFVQLKQNEADIEKLSQKLNTLYAASGSQNAPLANPSRGKDYPLYLLNCF